MSVLTRKFMYWSSRSLGHHPSLLRELCKHDGCRHQASQWIRFDDPVAAGGVLVIRHGIYWKIRCHQHRLGPSEIRGGRTVTRDDIRVLEVMDG